MVIWLGNLWRWDRGERARGVPEGVVAVMLGTEPTIKEAH